VVAILLYLPFWLILVLLCFSRRKQAGAGDVWKRGLTCFCFFFLNLNYFLFRIFCFILGECFDLLILKIIF